MWQTALELRNLLCSAGQMKERVRQSKVDMERDKVKKFVYCMAIDEIANRSRDKKTYLSFAVNRHNG